MTDLEKAQKKILDATPVLGRESVHILEALGRVLARDIGAPRDVPLSDISAMDGYALCHGDWLKGASKLAPVALKIVGESPAGRPCGAIVGSGQAVRIMTGGLIPEGADTVIKAEDTFEDGDFVLCLRDPGRGANVRLQGETLKKGDAVLSAGDVVTPVEVGLLASVGRAYVQVYQKPLVAIISTGDELVDFHEPLLPGKTFSSNLYGLAAQVLECNATPLCLGICPDDLEELQAVLSEGLRADLIITSGGMSMGKYDLVRKSLAAMGMKVRFQNVFFKPGKPLIFGTIDGRPAFGLPGNPSAAMISFEQFVRPALKKMMGHKKPSAQLEKGVHSEELPAPLREIDSFRHGNSGGLFRASLVPMKKPVPGNGKLRDAAAGFECSSIDKGLKH